MDLKRNQITVGELLDHPGARAVFQRRFPMLMKHPHAGSGPHHHPGADFVCGPGIRTAEEDRRDPQ